MSTNFAELMNQGKTAKNNMITDDYMACQTGAICKNYVVAQYAIMCDMDISHEKIVIADARDSAAFLCTDMKGTKLTHDIIISDQQLGRLVSISSALWDFTNRSILKNMVIFSYTGMAGEGDKRAYLSPVSYLYIFSYDGKMPN
jgi:hypothetical protein